MIDPIIFTGTRRQQQRAVVCCVPSEILSSRCTQSTGQRLQRPLIAFDACLLALGR
jgi:hypothetical protein